jgi:hypothetical protein
MTKECRSTNDDVLLVIRPRIRHSDFVISEHERDLGITAVKIRSDRA